MKRFLQHYSFLIFILLLPAVVRAQAMYTYTNASGGAYSYLAPNLTATGVTQVGTWGTNTPCTNGGGISGITVSPTFSSYNPSNASSPALNVDIQPNAGYGLNVTSITVNLRRSSTGPTQAMMAYSVDGGTTWVSKGAPEAPNNGSCGAFSSHSWTLSAPVSLCSGLFKFRVYYYAPGASTGTIQFANLNINGSVSTGAGSVTHTNDTICPSGLPYNWNGHLIFAGGTEVAADTFPRGNGCDSIVALNLFVKPQAQHVIYDTICHSELPYIWNGITIIPTGNTAQQQVIHTGANGCDSITLLNLFVSNPPVYAVTNVPPDCGTVVFEGHTYTNSMIFNDTLPTTYGCDSVYREIHITVHPFPVVNLGNDTAICPQDTIWLNAGNLSYSHLWNTGDTTSAIPVNDSGVYSVTVTSGFGCSSTADRHIAWLPAAYTEGFNFIPYFYDNLGSVVFSPLNPQNVTSYLWDFGDGSTSTDMNPVHAFSRSGDYLITLNVFNGCGRETYSQPVHVDAITGIAGTTLLQDDILLYPNPSKDMVIIENKNGNNHINEVRIYNMLGRLVYSKEIAAPVSRQQVDVASFASGIYSVMIRTKEGLVARKFEIIR